LELEHVKIFILTQILFCHNDSEIQEESLVCPMQLLSGGQALETKEFDMDELRNAVKDQVRQRLDQVITKLEKLYKIQPQASLKK